MDGRLDLWLTTAGTDCVVVTGGETDMCVLATVLGAVDRGLRVILVADAVCSSVDDTHDATMELYRKRFGVQIETLSTEALLDLWPRTLDVVARGRTPRSDVVAAGSWEPLALSARWRS